MSDTGDIAATGAPGADRSHMSIAGLSLIIPAYNEEGGIESVLDDAKAVLHEIGIAHEIIVVDDCSRDATARLAEGKGVRVLRNIQNGGYGYSLMVEPAIDSSMNCSLLSAPRKAGESSGVSISSSPLYRSDSAVSGSAVSTRRQGGASLCDTSA